MRNTIWKINPVKRFQIPKKIIFYNLFETKLYDSFPSGQLFIDGYQAPFRFDRNGNRGGMLLYVREDMRAKAIHCDFPPAESIYVENNLHKKWFRNCSYRPHKNNLCRLLELVSKALDAFYLNMKRLMQVLKTPPWLHFVNPIIQQILWNKLSALKIRKNLADLILTNRPKRFQITCFIETGLHMFCTVWYH